MNRLNVVRVGVVLGVAFIGAGAVVRAQTDPHIGTWVLDLKQSSFATGTAPKTQTSVYSVAGQGIRVATTTVNAGGTVNSDYTANFDGKDYPVKGNPDWDTAALKKVDARTIEFTRKKGGKVVQEARSIVSADGKSRTVTVTGVNATGQKLNTKSVWIKK